jgi:nucleotide-binding universal stress UspA family protein
MTTRPVVAGTDGSEESLLAVEWAALEARRRRAPLRIVSAVATPPLVRPYYAAGLNPRGTCARALGEAATRAWEVAPDVVIEIDLLAGPAALALADSGNGALMLVVGARGAGGFASMLLGSVSRYVAMHAACPVAVVREETSAVHREIVVGVRGSNGTDAALAFGFDEAARRGATLAAVHCWWPFAGSLEPDRPERVAAAADRALSEILAPWREKYPEVPMRQDTVHGHPGRILAWYSARADLVVIGRGAQGGTGPVIGAVQHSLLGHACGPVAVVPSQG